MPGMFGVVGMTSELRDRCAGIFAAPWGACDIEATATAMIGAHSHTPGSCIARDSPSIVVADGEGSVYAHLTRAAAPPWKMDSGGIELTSSYRGNIAVWNENERQLAIASEWTGAFPLYYAHRVGAGFLFASRMSVIASVLHPPVDGVGL